MDDTESNGRGARGRLGLVAVQAHAPARSPAGRRRRGAGRGRGGGRGGPPLVSPEVKVDNTVTLRFRAPNAQQVTLIGELDGKTYPMTKDEGGVWSVTIGPLAPDVYNYQFNVDGVIAMDPVNPAVKLGFGAFPPANMFEIPGDEFDDAKNVPARDGAGRDLPLEDDGRAAHDLGLHAAGLRDGQHPLSGVLPAARPGNTDNSWMLTGRANYIMDNLIAEGKTKPMIIVNPLGYVRQGVNLAPRSRWRDAPTGPRGAGAAAAACSARICSTT